MPKQKFEPTEGLLEDVMTKQAGSVQKAVLEAVMNSVDADASTVDITIEKDVVVIKDDGDGMTVTEVDRFFRMFGLKAEDVKDKDFGKFRMGRGQIFNFGRNIWHSKDNMMVVNLRKDTTDIKSDLHNGPKTVDGEEHAGIIESDDNITTVDSSGLSYNLLELKEGVDGCNIYVDLYEDIEDVDDTVEEVKKLIEFIPWLHEVTVKVNGEKVFKEPEIYRATDQAYFIFEQDNIRSIRRFSTYTSVYNQGAFVKRDGYGKVAGAIISKVDLDVNFARNDILDNDQTWREIKDDYIDASKDYLLERGELSEKEKVWLLEKAKDDIQLYNRLRDLPILEDINGDSWTLEELQNENVSYSHTGNKMAKEMMERTGTVILKKKFAGLLRDLVEEATFLKFSQVVEDESTFEMSEIDEDKLSKKRKDRLQMARWLLKNLGFYKDVEGGFSKHSDVWMDDDGTLYIHKGLLKRKKMEFLTTGLMEIVEVAALDEDTREERQHGRDFKKRYWRYMKEFGQYQRQLLEGNADYKNTI